MESFSSINEPFPRPPPYLLPNDCKAEDVRIYQIVSPCSPPPVSTSFSFSPGNGCSTQTHSPPAASATPPSSAVAEFMSTETDLCCSPTPTTCSSCRTQVISEVTFKVGTQAWLICLVFVLCGLVLGCCLIPFFLNHFKDAYHSCPLCGRVLHVHKKTCCQ